MQIALEDLQTHVDHLTTLSLMAGESLSTLAETVVENRVEEDALQIRNINRILALETSLGKRDCLVKIVPSILSTTKTIQGVNYKHSPLLKYKLPFLPSYEDFGDDTKPESIYYLLLGALESAEKALENNIDLMLRNCKVDLILLCKKMLYWLVKFVMVMFKYMGTAYKQLHALLGDKAKTWELVSFCVLEIFVTEFKAGQQLAIGFSSTKLAATGSKYVFSSLSLMTKVDEFLKIGIINHPPQAASAVRFLIKTSHNTEVKALEKKVANLEAKQ